MLRLILLFGCACFFAAGPSSAFNLHSTPARLTSLLHSTNDSNGKEPADGSAATKLYFDIAIVTPAEDIPLGRLTFKLTPTDHPYHLPLHSSNLISLATGQRKSIDRKATYEGCEFQYSPGTIDDGSFRYKWGHVCVGNGRNGIQVTSSSGAKTAWDEPFSDPERVKECKHECFGGVYYGQRYDEIVELGQDAAVLLTVPIQGPGAGTSKFSIVRVSESPKEWGERLLHNSAVVGYLDCNADGTFGGSNEEDSSPSALEVLRYMAKQRFGPPKIVHCGATSS